jgi:endonuclease III
MREDNPRIGLAEKRMRKMEALLQVQWETIARKPALGPLKELILTILSQNTSDQNSGRAFRALRHKWHDWNEMRKAPLREIEETIQEGGLAHIKAGRIKAILEQIHQDRGALSLDFLKALSDREVWDYLISFKGVGPKTAACVMLFSLNRPAFPVDTHVYRVVGRVTGVDERINPAQMQEELQKVIPPGLMYSFHLHLVRHGRLICRPRNPLCGICKLLVLCVYGKQVTRARSQIS